MKKVVTIHSIIFLMFLLLGFDCMVGHAQDKVVKLNFQAFYGAVHWSTPLINEWAKEIEKGTNGTVLITRYDMGVLTPMAQTYDSIVRGVADMGELVLGYTPGRFPFMEIGDLPLGGGTAYANGKLANALYEKYKPKEFDNVKILFFLACSQYRLQGKKPIRTLEELKGLKVRASGSTAPIVKLLGATPVAMPVSEAYDALSRGVVDADWNFDEGLRAFRLADVSKYSMRFDASTTTLHGIPMNKAKWNSLSPRQQKVIEEANSRLKEKFMREWDTQEIKIIEWAKKEQGVQFITLSAEEQKRWGEKVKPLVDDWVQKAKKLGLPAEDALKFATDYLKAQK